jgi:hypothetical protein
MGLVVPEARNGTGNSNNSRLDFVLAIVGTSVVMPVVEVTVILSAAAPPISNCASRRIVSRARNVTA